MDYLARSLHFNVPDYYTFGHFKLKVFRNRTALKEFKYYIRQALTDILIKTFQRAIHNLLHRSEIDNQRNLLYDLLGQSIKFYKVSLIILVNIIFTLINL